MGAVLNYKYHLRVIWAYTIMHLVIILIAYSASAQLLNSIFLIDAILTAAYFIESIVYMIIMSQFLMLEAVIKTRFTALNNIFW